VAFSFLGFLGDLLAFGVSVFWSILRGGGGSGGAGCCCCCCCVGVSLFKSLSFKEFVSLLNSVLSVVATLFSSNLLAPVVVCGYELVDMCA
jgi:hypothetical protein